MVLLSCNPPDFLDDQDRQALFSEPTQSELDVVLQDWAFRDLSPQNYTVEQEIPIGTAGTVLQMVSFELEGLKQYGAIVVPNTENRVPVRMVLNGFSFHPERIETSTTLVGGESFDIPYIFAIPAFRGQAVHLVLNGTTYSTPISEGDKCNAFDKATDDAIAFLNSIESELPNADMEKVSVRGGSRGGTVALLMGERDKRVKKVIGVAGPTNMLVLTSKNENDPIYKCQFLKDLVNEKVTLEQARHTMIASSPIYFAQNLPSTQLHLAQNDRIVPVSQGKQLESKIEDLNQTESFKLFIYENRDHTNIATMNSELRNRIQDFLLGF